MKHVLYLCSADADFQTRRIVETLCAGLGENFATELVSVGKGGTVRTGLQAAGRLLRSPAHLVHAFGFSCLRIATFSRKPLVYTPAPFASRRDASWLRAAAPSTDASSIAAAAPPGRADSLPARAGRSGRDIRVCCLSGEDHRTLIEAGVLPEACHLVRPGVRLPQPQPQRASRREQLGLRPDDKAVLLLDQPGLWGNPLLGAQVVSILHALDPRYRLLLCGKAAAHRRLEATARGWRPSLACNLTQNAPDSDLSDMASLADFAILAGQTPFPQLPVLSCMAAGVPLVASATRPVGELLEDHHTALLALPKPKPLAQRLLKLAEDEPLRRKLTDAARAEAYELFPTSAFLDTMRQLYRPTTA